MVRLHEIIYLELSKDLCKQIVINKFSIHLILRSALRIRLSHTGFKYNRCKNLWLHLMKWEWTCYRRNSETQHYQHGVCSPFSAMPQALAPQKQLRCLKERGGEKFLAHLVFISAKVGHLFSGLLPLIQKCFHLITPGIVKRDESPTAGLDRLTYCMRQDIVSLSVK